MRLTTFGVRRGVPLLFNVRIGRRHIHHFVPGIVLAFASGSAALFASRREGARDARDPARRSASG